ncbi:MAG: hypothetical protein K0R84_1773 [Clostridia bacterium]|jgi:hypothetical protein|nr:hypothetical protein [Clostridia bacterium]
MTVINKLTQTLEMLKMCESNCKTFSMDTDDPNAKQLYNQIAQQVKNCSDLMQSRVNYVMSEEPQYNQSSQQRQIQMMQQAQSQQQTPNNQNPNNQTQQ